ncbi:MAG TPA: nuclear transport factor 2 family protein [Verrucomicrobiae bacterium]|nr:nuclear transport factor 2 family protein [Verrucomicrobiae bacterium]
MKIKFTLVLAVAAICFFNLAARADDDAERAALRLIRTNYMEAVNSGDLSKLKNDLSSDVTGVMVTGEAVKGYNDLVNYWKGVQNLIGPGGSYHVTVNADKTDLFGDVAVSRGTTDETIRLPNGKELNFSASWTSVCHKENGVWKIFRVEATLDPINNIFVSYQRQKTKLIYGIGGLVIGVILISLVQFLRCRLKQ